MSDSPIHDQWKANGNCAMCRRRGYCKTQCSANKRLCRRIAEAQAKRILAAAMVRKAEVPDGQKV